jgi:hypothetical protein
VAVQGCGGDRNFEVLHASLASTGAPLPDETPVCTGSSAKAEVMPSEASWAVDSTVSRGASMAVEPLQERKAPAGNVATV